MIRENDCILMCSCTLSLIQKSKQSKRCSMFHNDSIIVIMIMDNVRYSYRVSITVECECCCGTIPAPRGRWRYTCKRSAQTFGGKASRQIFACFFSARGGILLLLIISLRLSLPLSLCHALSELRVEDKSMDLASESVIFRRLTDR